MKRLLFFCVFILSACNKSSNSSPSQTFMQEEQSSKTKYTIECLLGAAKGQDYSVCSDVDDLLFDLNWIYSYSQMSDLSDSEGNNRDKALCDSVGDLYAGTKGLAGQMTDNWLHGDKNYETATDDYFSDLLSIAIDMQKYCNASSGESQTLANLASDADKFNSQLLQMLKALGLQTGPIPY